MWPGRPTESDESKAYVAALLGVLQRLPAKSTITIYCRSKWIVDAINGGLRKWNDEGRLTGGKKVRYAKMWKEVLQQIARIGFGPEGLVAKQPDAEGQEVIERLKMWARDGRP
jgi:hypothetical protein